jgi:hypothetical protein
MKAPALLENIRPGWKGLQGTKTLAHFPFVSFDEKYNKIEGKRFMTLAPSGNII